MLTRERGFSYTKKDDYPKSRTWRCPCRGGVKFKRCNAKVIQVKRSESFLTVYQQEDFTFFPHSQEEEHTHPPNYGVSVKVLISKSAKEKAVVDKFKKPADLLHEVLKDFVSAHDDELPNFHQENRKIINVRAKMLPKVPSANDLSFEIPEGYFNPKFNRGKFVE